MCIAGLVCVVAAGEGSLARAGAASASGAILVVSTTADVVNGDVSSPAALIAHPGPDGISLREAITAADSAAGRHAITFAPALAGQTITPSKGSLPSLTRDDSALIGLTAADGEPAVTLNASGLRTIDLLSVEASDISISHLRITGLSGNGIGIHIDPGQAGGELQMHDVRIEQNVLDNGGQPGYGIAVGPDPGSIPTGATLDGITIRGNVVRGFLHDGINATLPCHQCSLRGLVIADNSFSGNRGPGEPTVELGTIYAGNKIEGAQIVRNSFTDNWLGVGLNGGGGFPNSPGGPIATTGNTVSGTVIAQNTFVGNSAGVSLIGGVSVAGATGNSVADTKIENNLFTRNAPYGAISLAGGNQGASRNTVTGVRIVSDTIAANSGGLSVATNNDGGTGNQITGIEVRSSIFWQNGPHDFGGPDIFGIGLSVSSSITTDPGFASGDLAVDPRFASAQDFQLQSGSPAINAGAGSTAPAVDLEDGLRDSSPDIGAYEYGAPARPRLDVFVEELGGAGTVTSTPAGIACERGCEAAFDNNSTVTLTAAPAVGSVFTGWSGACSGTGPCTLALAAAATVTATFSPPAATAPPPPTRITVNVAVRGKGRVSGGGISCPARCTTTFASGAKLTLRASPSRGYRFAGWSGACKGLHACTLHPKAAIKVTATFRKAHS